MRAAGPSKSKALHKTTDGLPVHWTADEDDTWKWFERESWIDDEWLQTGITTPIHKETGERKAESDAYLADDLLPAELRIKQQTTEPVTVDLENKKPLQKLPTVTRRSRHGRPPSKWLRSLEAEELSIWLATIETREAGVSGMTYFEHLTRDHSFNAEKITGLTDEELAKLHGAAHFGY
jgi:hypothetical protein